MKVAKIIKNDVVNGIGICTSLWVQGCLIRCPNCHNQDLWDLEGGIEINNDILIKRLKQNISANGIQRSFSILGGEPLDKNHRFDSLEIISAIRHELPDIKIFLWTGFDIDPRKYNEQDSISCILQDINYLISGPYVDSERDITLWLRGSRNQNVYKLTENKKYVKIDMINGKETIINE